MFEIWADKAEPTLRLVTRIGSALPAELGPRDWLRLGPYRPDPSILTEVETRGFHFFHSDEPLPDPDQLKNANAGGA